MRMLDSDYQGPVRRVQLYLSPREAADLRDALDRLLEDPDAIADIESELGYVREELEGYQRIYNVLRSGSLQQLQVFRVGDNGGPGWVYGEVKVFWVGVETETGDMVGVHTVSVET